MADGGIFKESGRATLNEFQDLRRRLRRLEQIEAPELATGLVASDTDSGPVTSTPDTGFLKLDASNDPVTGDLALGAALSVAGATTMAGTLAVTQATALNSTLTVEGLTTHSEMIHIDAPAVGVANLRLRSAGASATTITPGDASLLNPILWADANDITASDGASMAVWQTRGGVFTDQLMVAGTSAPIFQANGGPGGNTPCMHIDSARGWMQRTGTWAFQTNGNDKQSTIFSVYRVRSGSSDERHFGGTGGGAGTAKNVKMIGSAAGSTFKVEDIANSNVDTISDPLTVTAGWHIAVVRHTPTTASPAERWHCWLDGTDLSDGDTYNAQAGQARSITAIGRDSALIAGEGQAYAEIIIYDHYLTDEQTTQVHNYLSEKWGLGVQIGGGTGKDYVHAIDESSVVIMKLTADAKLSLGKTTPSATLDVVGSGEFTTNLIVGGNILCSGQVSAGTLAVSGTTTLSVSVIESATVGTLAVTGLTTLSDTDVQALTAGTLVVSGLTTLSNTDVQVFTAVSLAVSGLTTLGDTVVAGLDATTLAVSGLTTFSDNVHLDGDNTLLRFGDGISEASIFWDGSNLIINPAVVGNNGELRIRGSSTQYCEINGNNGNIDIVNSAPTYAFTEIGFSTASDFNIQLQNGRWDFKDNSTGINNAIVNIHTKASGFQNFSNTFQFKSNDFIIDQDNAGLVLGEGQDVDIFYNGTDLIINPRVAGSGGVKILSPAVILGDRCTIPFGDIAVTGTKNLNAPGSTDASATLGFVATRPGSILAIGWSQDRALMTTDDDITYEVRVNGSIVFSDTEDSTVQSGVATQARGTDTFAAGDIIIMSVTMGGSFSGNINISTNVELIYDE